MILTFVDRVLSFSFVDVVDAIRVPELLSQLAQLCPVVVDSVLVSMPRGLGTVCEVQLDVAGRGAGERTTARYRSLRQESRPLLLHL